jgi:hypothetical protein
MKPIIKKYDSDKYKFKELLLPVFNVTRLDQSHLLTPELYDEAPTDFSNETKTYFHRIFYEKLNNGWPDFIDMYHSFVVENIANIVGEKSFLLQTTPSFRVQVPNQRAISLWHFDSDLEHRHPSGELNFQIPLTKTFDTNALWIESSPGLKDYAPIEMEYGEFAQLDGNKCTHGNKKNKTGLTRMSFDFRILTLGKYDENYSMTSGDIGKRFVIGEYYSLFINGEIKYDK